jgi:chloramphenicol-sensitive protein RarD
VTATPERQRLLGVAGAAGAYLIWGLFPIYFHALVGVPATEVLAHRVIWSALFMTALITATRRWPEVAQQLRSTRTIAALGVSALLISGNWLTYIWAVQSGRVLEASLGYFVNPLVSVLLAVVFLKEPLNRLQVVAILVAAVGVAALVIWAGAFPLVGLSLALTFGLYGLVRKQVRVDAVAGLFAEVVLLFPVAITWALLLSARGEGHFGGDARPTLLLAASGVVTAIPLLLFAVGVRRLRLSTVGILQYLNPTEQFLLAVFLFSEPFASAHLVAFPCIWASLALYTFDAWRRAQGGAPRP